MVRVFYIFDVSTLNFNNVNSSPAYNFRMSFTANVLIVDKGKMSFLTEGLSDGRVRMSFTANALTLCHLEEPFGIRY